jgi:release factor glutamine methyltransferase
LLLCHLLPPGTVNALAVDVSTQACQLAHENALSTGFYYSEHRKGEQHLTDRNVIRIIQADILKSDFVNTPLVEGQIFDVITCNPPYVSFEQYLKLPKSVKDYEDSLALVGNISEATQSITASLLPEEMLQLDGLAYYRALQKLIPRLLRSKRGILAAEFGFSQSDQVRNILGQTGLFDRLEIWKDLGNIDRVAVGIT